jgi:preprotein translocase subunit SecA
MSTEETSNESMDVSILEKIGDTFSAFSEAVAGFITRLLGSSNERHVKKLGYIRSKDGSHQVTPGSVLGLVNDLEPKIRAMSDEELRGLTPKFRERLRKGETLDDILPEAFAACREAGRRTKNMRHFDVQIVGGAVLHKGNIAEMVTGEGKTLVATLPAYLNALELDDRGQPKGVHVVTVNDYLARRDCEWMLPIYRALGIEAGFIQSDQDPVLRRKAYDCEITYGTNSEFGFDYLRDNMKPARWADNHYPPWHQQVQKALNYAIIDEVDNILIDEARTPLIISGPAFGDLKRYARANEIAIQLGDLQKQHPGTYFEVKEKEHTCHLTDDGIRKAEELAGVESFYTAGNMEWPHLIDNSLKAHHLYKKDKQYAVMRHPETGEMSIIIIDEFTGRLMIGRQWSDGLHQAVEAKHGREGVQIKQETQTLATITIQNFFKLYKKLAGMTGTAMTEANEFWKIYKLDVIAIPTNKQLIRKNFSDMIYRTEKEKWKAVMDEVVEVNQQGRPILIGTVDVDKSIKLSDLLKRKGIKHELLNALPEHAQREAEIVAQAGRIGSVTIATNMAGRGTDIVLGGNPETLAWAKLKQTKNEDGRLKYESRLDVPEDLWKKTVEEIETGEKMKEQGREVAKMGGLHIIGTERHEARRIDNQLRGRAGRQGDPGSSRFYLCLEDDLMRIFAGEWVKNVLTRLGMEDGQAIESNMVSRRIQAAQKKREEYNFDIRKNLLEYDEVMDHQRKDIYGYRQRILEGNNCKLLLLDMIDEQISSAVDEFLDDDYGPASFAEFVSNRLGLEYDSSEFSRSPFGEAERLAREKASRKVPDAIQESLDENLSEDVEQTDWNWQAMAESVNRRWNLKYSDRDLKKIGRGNLAEKLIHDGEKALAQIDLSSGERFLQEDWGLRSLVDWVRLKFQITVSLESLKDKKNDVVKELIIRQVHDLYQQKEVELPVKAGMARYMAEQRQQQPQFVGMTAQRYDRDGLYKWAKNRFGNAGAGLSEEEFHTQSRGKLQEMLVEASKKYFPKTSQEAIDDKLTESLEGTQKSEPDDARELVEWAKAQLGLEVSEAALTGVSEDQARQVLWNAFDEKYRPEMRGIERGLLLNRLDMAWKNHLYTMDHLRSIVGLRAFGQEDPKTVYKREGMKEFAAMKEGLQDKVTDAIFRLEDEVDFGEAAVWTEQTARHDTASKPISESDIRGQQDAAIANSGTGDKKIEPIRNKGEKVGRNDPCPCGSGKKYKNCHMRAAAK